MGVGEWRLLKGPRPIGSTLGLRSGNRAVGTEARWTPAFPISQTPSKIRKSKVTPCVFCYDVPLSCRDSSPLSGGTGFLELYQFPGKVREHRSGKEEPPPPYLLGGKGNPLEAKERTHSSPSSTQASSPETL